MFIHFCPVCFEQPPQTSSVGCVLDDPCRWRRWGRMAFRPRGDGRTLWRRCWWSYPGLPCSTPEPRPSCLASSRRSPHCTWCTPVRKSAGVTLENIHVVGWERTFFIPFSFFFFFSLDSEASFDKCARCAANSGTNTKIAAKSLKCDDAL